MNVEGIFYVNDKLEKLMFDELKNACRPGKINQNDKPRLFLFCEIHFYNVKDFFFVDTQCNFVHMCLCTYLLN